MEEKHICPEILDVVNNWNFPVEIMFGYYNGQKFPYLRMWSKEQKLNYGSQIDFCPYCGTELSNHIRKDVAKPVEISTIISPEYMAYRQRWKPTKDKDVPMGRAEFEKLNTELNEATSWLPYATEEKPLTELKRRVEWLRKELCTAQ